MRACAGDADGHRRSLLLTPDTSGRFGYFPTACVHVRFPASTKNLYGPAASTSQSAVKKTIFNKAIDTGLQVVQTITDENGFIDVYPHMDITRNASSFLN
jgi:hypothetical protein